MGIFTTTMTGTTYVGGEQTGTSFAGSVQGPKNAVWRLVDPAHDSLPQFCHIGLTR